MRLRDPGIGKDIGDLADTDHRVSSVFQGTKNRRRWYHGKVLAATRPDKGAILLHKGPLHNAFALGLNTDPVNQYAMTIGVGAWLGTIMLFNVWVLIWPNQKKVLGMVEASADQVAKAKNIAFMASRSNTLMSIPMVMSMVGAGHGWPM